MIINKEYGKFLNKHNWDYFSTLTYKWDIKQKQNRYNMDRMINSLKKKSISFTMFWISEWHLNGTSMHNHLLLKGNVISNIDSYWVKKNLGSKKYNYHLKYDDKLGASYYLTKYINKNIDYDYVWH